uniref:Uncharacterized protein n=1 Tax=Dunaliella tertiolecta TaxID=3047 RepID=A0A7S3QRR7_DUNTE
MHSISQTTEAMRKRVAEASMLSLEVSKDRLQQAKSLRPGPDRQAAWRNKMLRKGGYEDVKMVQKQGSSLNRDEMATDSTMSSLNDASSDDDDDDENDVECIPPAPQSPSVLQQQTSPLESPRWKTATVAPYPDEDSGWHQLKVTGSDDIPDHLPRRASTVNTPRCLSSQRSHPPAGSRSPSLNIPAVPSIEGVLNRLNNVRFGSGSIDGGDSHGNSRRTTYSGGGGCSPKSVMFADGLLGADLALRQRSGMPSGLSSGCCSPSCHSPGRFRALPTSPTPGVPDHPMPRRLPRRAASQLVMSSRGAAGSLPTSQPGTIVSLQKPRRASMLQPGRADQERIDQARRDAMGSILGTF